MTINLEVLRELLVVALDVIRRRWKMFLILPALALAFGAYQVQTASIKYTSSALILIQGANRPAVGTPVYQQPNAIEQLNALDTWLKSDQVLTEITPIIDEQVAAKSPAERDALLPALRQRINLVLHGSSVIELSMDHSNPVGLGRRLERVVAYMIEALTEPDKGLFNASQFVLAARRDEVEITQAALVEAIRGAGFDTQEALSAKIKQLETLARTLEGSDRNNVELIAKLRSEVSDNPEVSARLEELMGYQRTARASLDAAVSATSGPRAYVGIFASPENLVVVGRPRDPTTGKNSAIKIAIAALLMSILIALGLVAAVEILEGRLRLRRDYETLTGLPVVARFPKLPS